MDIPNENDAASRQLLNEEGGQLIKNYHKNTRSNSVCISEVPSLNEMNRTVDLIIESLTQPTITNSITEQEDVHTMEISSSPTTEGKLHNNNLFVRQTISKIPISLYQRIIIPFYFSI